MTTSYAAKPVMAVSQNYEDPKMARVIIVLVSTFMCALLGLLMGYLSTRAQLETLTRAISSNALLFNYFVVPFLAGLIGFTVSSVTLKQFGPPKQ